MPDVATIRDVARKLEGWRDTLSAEEQQTLKDWMALGLDPDDVAAGRPWWFDPDLEESWLGSRTAAHQRASS